MKIALNKRSVKQLTSNNKKLNAEQTPQVAGGMYASSPHVPGCISYNGWTCNSMYNC
ncbi:MULTISPECIES: hypothetical protein [Pseudoalteromonas]|uniref:Uncharacterized protein n=2 Tax=Pseudoalteromonas TaxID=53246 RepID=V4HTH2_PSEL2|nr:MULTISPECIES: hypothetical protein [Pseudoalteromonas]ESP94120.1 hypothetical protein PL2TA16_02497 [Pseudoalteromonas luteoviolacea 2ta16]KZN42721.1 hypothetical protein N483_10090 [Pseudoalteromonas luteoviolacea NCIMB 1944]MBQ4839349.1 hypothetical protein [Pseudoalteromonas luteoviolacea]MCG7549768.1 hypothetical protein [Pseudoalteromonas sp. Of7M-16]MDK2597211.1 hypothetical protein [Pseudoalteromonas sp. P94(2023)]